MTEYCLGVSNNKSYGDVIRERFLNFAVSDNSKEFDVPRPHFASVPLFGVDSKSFEYLIYTEGTSICPLIDITQKDFDISFSQIKSLIEAESVEVGMDHPAMDYLQLMLKSEADRGFLKATLSNGIESWLKADVLLCLADLEIESCSDYLIGIVAESIKSGDIRVRDAAVQVLEAISSEAAIWLLKQQIQSEEVTWLRNYAEQIVEEYHSGE